MKIVGLAAKKRSGKSTTLAIIEKLNPGMVNEVMLAGAMKKFLSKEYGVPTKDIEDQTKKEAVREKPFVLTELVLKKIEKEWNVKVSESHKWKELTSIRHFLQYLGTEVLRSQDPDIHLKKAASLMKPGMINVVTDIRFKNELEFFMKMDGFVSIGLDRPSEDNHDLHPSEAEVPEVIRRCDHLIVNNGTLEDLERKVSEISDSFIILPRGLAA